MHEHEVNDDPTAFETLVRKKEIHLSRDYFLNSWTVKNIRAKQDDVVGNTPETRWRALYFTVNGAHAFVIKFKRLDICIDREGFTRVRVVS